MISVIVSCLGEIRKEKDLRGHNKVGGKEYTKSE